MEKAIPFSSSQPCGKAEYNEAKILPVLKQHSCSPTQIGERFSLCAFWQHPHGVPLVGDSGLQLEAQLFSVRRKMLPFIWFKYFLLHCYYHAFQAYARISSLLLFLCQLLQKGLMKVKSGGQAPFQKGHIDFPACSAGPSPRGTTALTLSGHPKSAEVEVGVRLRCPAGCLPQGCTGHC